MEIEKLKADVIILSAPQTRGLTIQTVETLQASEDNIQFNIFVIEDSTHYYYGVENIKLNEEFNYNKFMNVGASRGSADYIVFCNNDLIFHKEWFTELLKYNFDCMSPMSPRDFRQNTVTIDVVSGHRVGYTLSGWCFVLKRSIWEQIGRLDEKFKFWYADDATMEQLKRIGVQTHLITKSIVEHIGSQTLILEPPERQTELTTKQNIIFRENYG